MTDADEGGELKEGTTGGWCCCFIRYSEPENLEGFVETTVQQLRQQFKLQVILFSNKKKGEFKHTG